MALPGEPLFQPLFDEEPPTASEDGPADAVPEPHPETPQTAPQAESSFAPLPEANLLPPPSEFDPVELAAPVAAASTTEPESPSEPAAGFASEFPFHVRIDGSLADHEKDKLLSLLGSEDFGVRPVDIEPQLDSGAVLLPRMSRYATAYLLQNLPLSQAVIRVQPIDEGFSDQVALARVRTLKSDTPHPADQIPVTQADQFPQMPNAAIFDVATATLTAPLHEVQDAFERLKRKLRFVAHARGAAGIVRYRQETASTLDAGFARLTATGDLVREPASS